MPKTEPCIVEGTVDGTVDGTVSALLELFPLLIARLLLKKRSFTPLLSLLSTIDSLISSPDSEFCEQISSISLMGTVLDI